MLAITKKPYDPSKRPSSDRYPSGDRVQGVSPTSFFRIRTYGTMLSLDPRLNTVLGHMGIRKELSDAEVDAGFKIAEIYGRYEMLQGRPRRTAASPSYERGFGNRDVDTSTMLPDELKKHRAAAKKAQKDFDKLQGWIMTRRDRDLIELVCCQNEDIGYSGRRELIPLLRELAIKLGHVKEVRTVALKPAPRADDGALLAFAAVEALVHWFFDKAASKPTHFSLVDNKDWKKTRGITGSDGKYHYTIPVPLRSVALEQMDAKLRLACAQVGMLEIGNAETGEVA